MNIDKETYGIPNVYASDLEKLARRIQQVTGNEGTEVSFEFIIASLFPTCWNNIQEAMHHQYTLGYIAGTKDADNHIGKIEEDADYFCN